jgi:Ser/Thr protein kinase RdoA (MazF antagonist)
LAEKETRDLTVSGKLITFAQNNNNNKYYFWIITFASGVHLAKTTNKSTMEKEVIDPL